MTAAFALSSERKERIRTASVVLSVGFMVAYSAWVVVAGCRAAINQWQNQRDKENSVNLAERRFDPIRAMLPARGIIGYRQDFGEPVSGEAVARYQVAQYTLAPIVLAVDEDRELTIIDSSTGVEMRRAESNR